MNKTRYSMLVGVMFLALVLSALNAEPVFADDSVPPEVAPTEEVSVEVTDPVEAQEEAETPPAEGEADSESSTDSLSVAEVIEALPENTELIVVDENGEALPLASEAAADVIAVADPQWCPVGVTPGAATCSDPFTHFNGAGGLIEWLTNTLPNKAGVIWIESGYVGDTGLEGGAIVLDGANYGNMANFALTINGGWTGTGKTLDPNEPSTFEVPFIITGWTGAVTINNIQVLGASGVGSSSLEVYTNSNIVINNVDVNDNTTQYGGAYFVNSSGTGNVTVNDSTFNNNTGVSAVGLEIDSKGIATIKNVTANGNGTSGIYIHNEGAATPKAVNLNGSTQASYNDYNGVLIYSKGVITTNNVTAMGNGYDGMRLDNCQYDDVNLDCDYGVANGVTIKGVNNFSDNGYDGLRVWSGGAITVNNITANGNGTNGSRPHATEPFPDNFDAAGKGAFLFNYGSLTPKAITISGTNTFNDNASTGLHADSSGKVTVSNLTASFNGCDLTFELGSGEYCAGAYIYAGGGVTQTGYGRFEGNSAPGLLIYSQNKGAVLLNNLYADLNFGDGVSIDGFGNPPINVTINGVNTFTNNLGQGLHIDTDGVITLSNLNASYNDDSGVFALNAYLTKAITLKGVNTFNSNGLSSAFGSGLILRSYGAITTSGITAFDNFQLGALLDNCWRTLVICDAPTVQKITMNGNNSFGDNGLAGLVINSRGAITVSNLTSTYNDDVGAVLENQFTNAKGGITIKGFAYVSNNQEGGLDIYSNGAISLANITANNSDNNTGVFIDNVSSFPPANVTITGTNTFNYNDDTGLEIDSLGVITLSNITANGNQGGGAFIVNSLASLAKSVSLSGNNTFNDNAGAGLTILSNGAIKVNNLMANYNLGASGYGAELDNNGSIPNQAITITGFGIFNGNDKDGLFINSAGNITLANITANNNVEIGANIDTQYDISPTDTKFANVVLTGVNTFNNNGAQGLSIYNDGNITISNITANDNGTSGSGGGALLNNFTYANAGATGIRTVTLSGVNMFAGNKGNGLQISSRGTVTLTRITANNNNDGLGTGSGLVVTTDGAINLTCGSMYNNIQKGYDLTAGSGKVITLKGVFTFGNGLVDTSSAPTVKTRTCPLP